MLADALHKILFVINPNAGRSQSKAKIAQMAQFLADRGFDITVHCTAAPKEATQFVRERVPAFDMVVCCGGDGTLNEVMSGVVQSEHVVPIGYIPAGSTNDLARTLHLPTQLPESMRIIATGKPKYHDIGCLNGNQYFSYVASFGAFTQVSYATPQWLKQIFGHFAYILQAIQSLTQIRPYYAKVKADGIEVEGEFIFGGITNSTSIGGFLEFDPQHVSLDDGKFEVLLIRNPHNPIRFLHVLAQLRRQQYDSDYVEFFQASHVEMKFTKAIGWTVDGEFAGNFQEIYADNLHNIIQIVRGT